MIESALRMYIVGTQKKNVAQTQQEKDKICRDVQYTHRQEISYRRCILFFTCTHSGECLQWSEWSRVE